MRWPWSFLLKRRSNNHDGDGEAEVESEPEETQEKYEQHGMKEKGERAQQLHRHDNTSKICLDDMDAHIQKLKKLKCRIKSRNGKTRHECKEEG